MSETTNAGQKWSVIDDKQLITIINDNIVTKTGIDYDNIAKIFKRTPGAIKARIQLNVYNMIDDENTIETLCKKYYLNLAEMNLFIQRMYNKSKKSDKYDKSDKSDKSDKISIEDVYNLLKFYKDDINEIKSSIKKINKKLAMLELGD